MAVLRPAVLAFIHGYRLLVSPILPRTCRFEPTCSAYGLQAIRRFGALTGGWLTLRRLIRCQPWGGSGFDPVPEAVPFRWFAARACSGKGGGCVEAAPGPDAAR